MANKSNPIFFKILLILVAAFFTGTFLWGCANIGGSPQGGPKDTIPPRVVRMSPQFNATNFWPGTINIEFDEFVQLKDIQKNFFTSPLMNVRPVTSINGKGIKIEVDADLEPNTTYVLNYGSSVVDYRESNPLIELKYTFSTGAHIDSLFMTGLIQDAMTSDTIPEAFIFFYDARDDSIPAYDSLLFNPRNALAVARTAPNGIFIHSNLKPMDYRVYAVLDNNGNQSYDPGVDDVAFLDTIYNPALMPDFYMWYDTVLMFDVAEPQIFMRSFREEPDRRQNLSNFTREGQQKVILKFSSKFPDIRELYFRDIDNSKVIVEYGNPTHDSIFYWFDIDKDLIPDTLYADIKYMRHDSIGSLYEHEQEFRFIYTRPFISQRERREQERASRELTPRQQRHTERKAIRKERKLRKKGLWIEPVELQNDSLMVNDNVPDSLLSSNISEDIGETGDSVVFVTNFNYNFTGGTTITPDDIVQLSFTFPVRRFDSLTVTMLHKNVLKETEEYVPVRIVQDSVNIRDYTLSAEWLQGDRYELIIPRGAIETIDGEINDTICRNFTIAEMDKYSSVILTLKNTNPEYEYIARIYDASGKNIQKEIPHLTEGTCTINYINPGRIVIRVVEDRNRNGKWDTGDLINRVQPEKVETLFDQSSQTTQIVTRANWDIPIDIDIGNMFRPRIHISRPLEQTEESVEKAISENEAEADEEKEEYDEMLWHYNMEEQFDSSVPLNIDQ